jgi:hypothetical protein
MSMCKPCSQIEQYKRHAPGHHALEKLDEFVEDWGQGPIHTHRYLCRTCGTRWEHENNKSDPHAGWSPVDD